MTLQDPQPPHRAFEAKRESKFVVRRTRRRRRRRRRRKRRRRRNNTFL